MANKVGLLVSVVDEATGKLRQIRATADDMPNSKGVSSGFGMGVGAGIAMQATQMVISAVAGMGSAIIGGAIDEEAALAKLGQAFTNTGSSLRANQTAVDELIGSNIKLGFTDDETINSLALLVTATGSLSEAQRFQAAAMDLARIKGIDLGTATEAMTRVEAGQYRALKSLGIVLPAHATALEALTAVEKAAGGQAQEFSDTTAGSMASLDASVKELEDSIGRALLPVIKSMSGALRDILPGIESFTSDAVHMRPILEAAAVVIGVVMVQALKKLATAAWGAMGPLGLLIIAGTTLAEMNPSPGFTDALKSIETEMLSTTEGTAALKTAMMDPAWRAANKDLADTVIADADAMAALGLTDVAGNITRTTSALEKAAGDAFSVIPDEADTAGTDTVISMRQTMADAASEIRAGREALVKAMTQTISDVYDPLVNAGEQVVARAQIDADKQAIIAGNLTGLEKAQADLQLIQDEQHYADLVADSTQYGTDAERLATLNGQRIAPALIEALNEGEGPVRDQARATYKGITDEIDAITRQMNIDGANAAQAYTDGMNYWITGQGAKDIDRSVTRLRELFEAHSPPGPESPLHEIDTWGRKTGEAYVGSLAEGLAPVSGIMGSLGGGGDGASGSVPVGGGSSQVININIDRGAFIDGPAVEALTRAIAGRLRLAGIS